MALLRQWLKLLNKIFVTGLLTAATVPHESEKRYINRRSGKIVKSQTNSTAKEVLAVLMRIPEAYALSLDERR